VTDKTTTAEHQSILSVVRQQAFNAGFFFGIMTGGGLAALLMVALS
jgi:hypothetical protein